MDQNIKEVLERLCEALRHLERTLDAAARTNPRWWAELKAELYPALVPDAVIASKGLTPGDFASPLARWLHDALKRWREAQGAAR